MKHYNFLLMIFMLIVTNVAFSNDHHKDEKGFINRDMLSEKFEKMSQFLDLNSEQQKIIKGRMNSSLMEMEESKDKLMKNKKALMMLDSNDVNFASDLSDLSEEIGALASEQAMLQGQSRERINNELNDDQRQLAKAFARIEKKRGKRLGSEWRSKDRRGELKKRAIDDKKDRRWNKKRRGKD